MYSVGGTISGLVNDTQVTLLNKSGDALTVNANGTFGFSTRVTSGTGYAVSVGTQPKGQTCVVPNGSGVVAASNVISIAVTCSRIGYAYVTNSSDNTVSQFSIGADGTLTPMAAASIGTGSGPLSIALDPTGNYAYVANISSSTVSQFTIGADGALTPMATASVSTGISPQSVTVDPSGKYAYVTNRGASSVSQYTIGADGALTPMPVASVGAGILPETITVDATGKYAYVTNWASNTVSQYVIDASGALTPMATASVNTGNQPTSITTRYAATH